MSKLLFHSINQFCIDSIKTSAELMGYDCIVTTDESELFEYCTLTTINAFVFETEQGQEYIQRAINTIRGSLSSVPIIILARPNTKNINYKNIDLVYLVTPPHVDFSIKSILSFIQHQSSLYKKITLLTPKKALEIYFGDGYRYDLTYRSMYLNGIMIRRFPTKEGRILEILSTNFCEVVKRDYLLQEIWHNTDIFVSRSLDVYITKLRNFFKEYDIKLRIVNISGVGLVLEQF